MAVARRLHWQDLSTTGRTAIVIAGLVQVGLLGAALADIRRRGADQLNGPRGLWTAVSFVNFVGPITYFVFGRRNSAETRALTELG